MATIRAYTTIEQSRKLAEILPLESADMMWTYDFTVNDINGINVISNTLKLEEKDVPAWSLAALLSVIRETIGYTIYGVNNVYMSCNLGDEPWKLETKVYDNEIDACVEMIIKLHKINLL
jgi:hypothetical protein